MLLTPHEAKCRVGWGQIYLFCVPEARYFVDCYVVACLRHAWDGHYFPTLHNYSVQCGVNRIVCHRYTQTFVNQHGTNNIDITLLTNDLIPFVGHQ